MTNDERYRAYWRANKLIIGIMLTIWASVSLLAGVVFIEQLNRVQIGNLPFGFWMAQQGSIVVFVIMVFAYAFIMDRIDHKYKYDVDEKPAAAAVKAGETAGPAEIDGSSI
jgi:putative solute:sodium symporter small subunit